MSGNFEQVTPFLHVPDLGAAVAFYEALGFRALFRMSDYAYVHRETVGIRILEYRPDQPPPPAHGGFGHYIDVADVDALHAELKPALDAMPPQDVHGPVDQEYGQRELMVRAPDGNLLVFGMAIAKG